MKITCEHCGSIIDTEHDKKCPTCGAPYAKSKEYEEVKQSKKKDKDYDYREREADIKAKELNNEIIEKTLKTSKKITIIPIIIFIVFIIIFIFVFKQINNTSKKINNQNSNINNNNNILDLNEVKEQTIIGNFNETLQTDSFDIKCDKITTYSYDEFEKKQKDKNTTYYNFHFVFTNKTNSWQTLNNINLTYTDDNNNPNIVAKKPSMNVKESKNELDFFAKEKLSYSGNITFEIPNYVTDVKIVFDKTIIQIDNYKEKITQ